MPDLVSLLSVPGLEFNAVLFLIVLSTLTSAITAAFGLGGGSLMIAVMSLMMPAAIVVPVHGAVQLGSNGGRAVLRRTYIQWQFVGWFILGSALGALAGGRVATLLPDPVFKGLIAVFLLYSVWVPKPEIKRRDPLTTSVAGAFSSAIGMVVGISGPLVIAFLRNLKDRHQIVGTHAFLMTCQNLFKLLTFVLFGFAFSAYLPLILAMVVSGLIGTYFGGFLLDKLPENLFRITFRIILTVVALDLARRAIMAG